jgi:F0F1-type ATP synthase membrane subunit b/b'
MSNLLTPESIQTRLDQAQRALAASEKLCDEHELSLITVRDYAADIANHGEEEYERGKARQIILACETALARHASARKTI